MLHLSSCNFCKVMQSISFPILSILAMCTKSNSAFIVCYDSIYFCFTEQSLVEHRLLRRRKPLKLYSDHKFVQIEDRINNSHNTIIALSSLLKEDFRYQGNILLYILCLQFMNTNDHIKAIMDLLIPFLYTRIPPKAIDDARFMN